MEYPQVSATAGIAQCLVLPGLPKMKQVKDSDCLVEKDNAGNALGGSYRLAVYGATQTLTPWTTVFTEAKGSGNGVKYDNSDLRTLNLVKPPFDVTKGNYFVRMEWGTAKDFAEFKVPSGRNIFGQTMDQHIDVTEVTTSAKKLGHGF